jgi:DNA-binding response OmpR family regulator
MRVLIAEDEAVSRRLLEVLLQRWGYQVSVARDGREAWTMLSGSEGPRLAVLDWMMPELDGLEICRRLRAPPARPYVYVILLTAKVQDQDIVCGFDAGADDYMTKPFKEAELRSRVRAGERILQLEHQLASKVLELQGALEHVKRLQGLLPICMHCHKVRDDRHIWKKLEAYVEEHSDAKFSHALCEECLEKHYPEVAAEARAKAGK